MDNPDIGLIDIAESGFHTGVFEPIKVSGIWRHQQIEAREDLPIKAYSTNWKSAEDDPDTVSRLIQQDINAKFVKEFLGVFEQAKKRWPKGVAVGRLSEARSDKRDPRLCFDSTIPNVDAKVQMEDKSFNPCVDDIVSAKVVTHLSEGVGLTIDVSKADKKTSHPRRRMGASPVPAPRHALPPHSVPLWSAIQCSLVEPHGEQ